MFRQGFALVLSFLLLAAAAVPEARAADLNGLVLHTARYDADTIEYRYLENGCLAYEEWNGGERALRYMYNHLGYRVDETHYENGKATMHIVSDWRGNHMETAWFDQGGKRIPVQESEAVYDEYGRLTSLHTRDPQDPYGLVSDIRCEYYAAPESFFLGWYEQDGNEGNGPEPIEWLVLDTDGSALLVVSRYGLDSAAYHNRNTPVSWKDSDLRGWFNGEFLNTAFPNTIADRSYVETRQTVGNLSDKVFLLSEEDVNRYFPQRNDRLCAPTEYAVKQNAYVNKGTGCGWWLLRTPGKTGDRVMSVNSDGSMDNDGGSVSGSRGMVRPAMWINNAVLSTTGEVPDRRHENVYVTNPANGQKEYEASDLYTYDNSGNLICYQNYMTGDMTEWEYDDHGNMTRCVEYVSDPAGYIRETTCTHQYNAKGQLQKTDILEVTTRESKGKATATEETSSITYKYDGAGRLLSAVTVKANGFSITEKRTYDNQGNLLKVTVNGKVTEEYTYTALKNALDE